MLPSPQNPQLRPGDRISAEAMNRLNDWARQGSAAPGQDTDDSLGGITPTHRPPGKGQDCIIERFLVKITAVSGTFPAWTYTGQRVIYYDGSQTGQARYVTDGINLTLKNGQEFAGTAPYTYGNGVTITNATTGEVNGTSCLIVPLGVGAIVEVSHFVDYNDGATAVYVFSQANSAES